nr:hypothetical protein [Thiobacillus denitrificans]
MSYTFSRALVEEYLAGCYSGTDACAPLKSTNTQDQYLSPGKTTDHSRLSRYGITYVLLTERLGAALLMWFVEDSRVKTLAQPEKAQESTESVADCGKNSHGLLAKYDPVTSSWKTAQCSLFEDLEQSLEIWPRWGSMRNGECYQRQMLVQTIGEKESGLLPTPLASNTKAHHMRGGGRPARSYWPTPKANDAEKRGSFDVTNPRNGLPAAVKLWATPTASTGGPEPEGTTGRKLTTQVGGQLNPMWVEWLMGWPLGWTDLKPLETDRCRSAQQRHGGF